MGFLVPNENIAAFADQARLDSLDLAIMAAAANGTGVYSGCLVSAQGTPDGTVAVTAGSYRIGGSTKTCAGGNVSVLSGAANPDGSTLSAAHANWPRYDLIVANGSNQLGVVHGQVTVPVWPNFIVNPVFPSFSGACLGAILVVPGSEVDSDKVTPTKLVTKDLLLNPNASHDQAHTITSAVSHSAGWVGKGYLPIGLTAGTSAMHAPGTDGQTMIAKAAQTDGWLNVDMFTQVPFAHPGICVVAAGPIRWYNRTGRTLTIAGVYASAGTPPVGTTASPITGAGLVFDVNIDGTTIWSTQTNRVNIQAAASTGVQTSFNNATLASGSFITADTDFIGSTTPGSDTDVQVLLKG